MGHDYELWTLEFDLSRVSEAVGAQTGQAVQPELMLSGRNTTGVWLQWIDGAWPC